MTDWIAIGRDGAEVEACAMQGARLVACARGVDEAAALAHLQFTADRTVHIGDGAPETLPAPVLPKGGRGLAGLTQDSPADVIGARVRLWIAGFLADRPDWDGVLCVLDGGISHWIHISANEAVSSQSFLTPRLIAALEGTAPPDPDALADSLSRPERLAAHLRAAEVSARPAALTGHLLGAELAAARPYWLGQQVALIAPEDMAASYAPALAAQHIPAERHAPDDLLPEGLGALARALGLAG